MMTGSVPPAGEDKLIDTAMVLIDRLQKGKASKKTVIALVVSIILDVGLSAGLILNSVGLGNTQSAVAQANLTQCMQDNAARAQDEMFLGALLSALVSPSFKVSAEERKVAEQEVAKLRVVLMSKDAPRNCQKIYGSYAVITATPPSGLGSS